MAFHDGTNGKTWWKNGGNPWIPEVHLLWIAGFHLVDFPTTHSGFQHECLAKSKVARFFRQIKWWVMGFLSHRLPMEISMGFFRLQFAEKKQVPRVTRAAPVKEALLDLLGSFQSGDFEGDFTYQKWEKLEFLADWLAVWNMNGCFFPIGNGIIIPIGLNSMIFQRGRYSTSQLILWWFDGISGEFEIRNGTSS